jgi:pimeloyl-ACP methyl ester carboxylesterase
VCGQGGSSQPWCGNETDTYADDLAALIETLDLKNVTLFGHSTGGGEFARYSGGHGSKRVSKAVLIAPVPPLMLKNNPGGPASFPHSARPRLRPRGRKLRNKRPSMLGDAVNRSEKFVHSGNDGDLGTFARAAEA